MLHAAYTTGAAYDYRDAVRRSIEAGGAMLIDREVDPLLEIPAVLKRVGALEKVPTVVFNNIRGYPGTRGCGAIFGDLGRLLGFLGIQSSEDWKEEVIKATHNLVRPEVLPSGPCKENIILDNIDIQKVMFPTHGALNVKHLYYQPAVITKHPATGAYNVAMYRACIQGPDRVTVNLRNFQHGGFHFRGIQERNAPMPVALCLGVHPALYVAAVTKMPYGMSEIDYAGGLIGRPLEMTRCETIDLMVPADAEVVIEGEIRPPYELGDDGPWPEYLRYLGGTVKPPILNITAITHRDQPINNVIIPGTVHNYLGLGCEAELLKHLREYAGEFVLDARLTSVVHHAIVKVQKRCSLDEGLQIGVATAALSYGAAMVNTVTLVDEDINIYDWSAVDWAVSTRCNPTNQVHVLPEHRCHPNNPIAGVRENFGEPITRAGMIVDATIPWNYRQQMKGSNLGFFSLSEWPEVNLQDYV